MIFWQVRLRAGTVLSRVITMAPCRLRVMTPAFLPLLRLLEDTIITRPLLLLRAGIMRLRPLREDIIMRLRPLREDIIMRLRPLRVDIIMRLRPLRVDIIMRRLPPREDIMRPLPLREVVTPFRRLPDAETAEGAGSPAVALQPRRSGAFQH